MAKVTMPQLGESVAEGTIGKWLKKPGDHVAKYEPLLEVITDKVNAEVPSPYEGILREILVEEGATVPNNAEIAVIDEVGGATTVPAPGPSAAVLQAPAPASAAAAAPPPTAIPPSPPPVPAQAASPGAHGPAGSDERAPHELPGNPDARMTPAVRRLLREHGLQAAMIVGTGGGDRITREDVTDYVESQRTGKPVGRQDATGPTDAQAARLSSPATGAGASPSRPAPAAADRPAPASSSRPGRTRSSSRRPRCARGSRRR